MAFVKTANVALINLEITNVSAMKVSTRFFKDNLKFIKLFTSVD